MSSAKNKKVFVALSGGVDSSVAAFLLQKEGYDVTGVFIRCFNLDGCAERDAEDARRVAEHLGIPFYTFDFEEDYKREVVNYMVEGYRRGETPNPDVMCNRRIKFGIFLEKSLSLGADTIATGHYVRLMRNFQFPIFNFQTNSKFKIRNSKFSLLQAKDPNKDQSYFLWTLTQEQLKHCLFPIGDYLKSEVREIARRAGLPTAEKKDSQGICFLGKVTLAEFLKQYIPENPGTVVTIAGKTIGEHSGAHFYTIGQRHGLGIGGGAPYYIAEKNVEENTLVVAEKSDNPALYRKETSLRDINFINPTTPSLIRANGGIKVLARVRYRQPLAKAVFNGRKLVFIKPQKFVAAGQSAVFYSEAGEMLGGGSIL